MDCRETEKFIQAYLDGEFDDQERAAVTAHLQSCEGCRRTARMEESFRRSLRALQQPVSAPPRLRASIRQSLAAVDHTQQRHRMWRWILIPALATATAAIVFQLALPLWAPRPNLAEESITMHRQQTLPMDVTGPSSAPVRRYFRDKVPFVVRMPQLDTTRARLVGARLSNLGPRQAAYLVYEVNGQRVSVFVTDPDAITSSGNEIQAGNRKMYHQGVRGYNVLKFVSGGTGYTVTSDMEQDRLVRLVSHVK